MGNFGKFGNSQISGQTRTTEMEYIDVTAMGVGVFAQPQLYYTYSASMNPVNADDADVQVMSFDRSLKIPSGVTMLPSNRCKGLYIFINGSLQVDGGISMSSRGASAVGVDTSLIGKLPYLVSYVTKRAGRIYTRRVFENVDIGVFGLIPAVGGTGAAAVSTAGGSIISGLPGTAGTNRKTGGGGSGGGGIYGSSTGRGGNGTSFSGGAGGSASTQTPAGTAGSDSGGAGGTNAAGNGAGNPTGGTGGSIFIFVNGNVYINSGAIIQANGAVGTGNGGGSGGGTINIMYGGTLVNNGTIQANGGAAGGYCGAGGAGCITLEKVTII